MIRLGLEPRTFSVLRRCDIQLHHPTQIIPIFFNYIIIDILYHVKRSSVPAPVAQYGTFDESALGCAVFCLHLCVLYLQPSALLVLRCLLAPENSMDQLAPQSSTCASTWFPIITNNNQTNHERPKGSWRCLRRRRWSLSIVKWIEVQLDGLQYEENKEQASIPPKGTSFGFRAKWRFWSLILESLCYSFLSPLLSKNQRPYDTSIVWQPFSYRTLLTTYLRSDSMSIVSCIMLSAAWKVERIIVSQSEDANYLWLMSYSVPILVLQL